jgi:hypothetical protein
MNLRFINNKYINITMIKCAPCAFTCKYQSEFNRHLKSIKHKENINSKTVCSGCFKEFANSSNRSRHEKKCNKIIQILEIKNNIETQNNITNNNTTNNNQNNTTNIQTQNIINILAPTNPEAMKSFVMTLQKLQELKTTDYFQKVILNQMSLENYDLMDCIGNFDIGIKEAHDEMINNHNKWCSSQRFVTKTDENGEEYEDIIIYTPLAHPDYNWQCFHAEKDYKLDENMISTILTNTLLDTSNDAQIVITHNKKFRKELLGANLLFKHKETLHTDDILLDFLSRSKMKHLFSFSDNFKPAAIIQQKYPEYYYALEEIAINLSKCYNEKMKKMKK